MSADLSVKCGQEFESVDFILEVQNSLKELLPISKIPDIIIKTGKDNSLVNFIDGSIGMDKQYLLIEAAGFDGMVSLIFTYVENQFPYVSVEEAGIWAGVSVAVRKNSWEFILAAAVAIAIAKIQDSTVIDDGCIWNKTYNQGPNEFVKSILNDERFNKSKNEILHKFE